MENSFKMATGTPKMSVPKHNTEQDQLIYKYKVIFAAQLESAMRWFSMFAFEETKYLESLKIFDGQDVKPGSKLHKIIIKLAKEKREYYENFQRRNELFLKKFNDYLKSANNDEIVDNFSTFFAYLVEHLFDNNDAEITLDPTQLSEIIYKSELVKRKIPITEQHMEIWREENEKPNVRTDEIIC